MTPHGIRLASLGLLGPLGLLGLLGLLASCGLVVSGCGALPVHGAPEEASAPELSRVLATGSLVRLLLPSEIPYREGDNGFSVRLRVENTRPHDVYLDLASPTLVGPTQFGAQTTPQRQIIDQRRMSPDALSAAEREALNRRRREGDLTRLAPGARLDLYVPFHGTGAQLFMGFATQWVFISLDGHLDAVSDSVEAARVSLAWTDERGSEDTDIVLSMPVALATRDCGRERRVTPRGGSDEWPVVLCAVR